MALPNETITFYLSGLVHQFGNLLLTIQGNAMGLGRGPIDRQKEAILTASARGGASLELLRILLGHQGHGPQAAEPLLKQMLELSRIPLRERGWTTRLSVPATPISIDSGTFVLATASGVRWLAALVPEGAAGVVDVRLDQAGARECGLRLSFETAPGSLPFPLPLGDLVAALAAEVPVGVRVRPEPGANGVELRFEASGGVLPAVGAKEA